MTLPFDAVLLISFGGPNGPEDIRPFLKNVLKNRPVADHRIEQVTRHYELFGGVSPIARLTQSQATGLSNLLMRHKMHLPVYVGMRNWHPFLADTLLEMAEANVHRAIGFIMAAHHSYSSCGQYRQNVLDARRVLIEKGKHDIDITYVSSWFNHPKFIEANAQRVKTALNKLPSKIQSKTRLLFTAHSIPVKMAARSQYHSQLLESAKLVAEKLKVSDWALVFQSRSGRPEDPWLEPDVGDYLKDEIKKGLKGVVICPIGFVADHIEILYDLDTEVTAIGRDLDLPITRAASVNDNSMFLDMMFDLVQTTCTRYATGPPLPLISLEIVTLI